MNINICLGFTCEEVETVAAFNSFNEYVNSFGKTFCRCEVGAAHFACKEESLFKVALNKTELERCICGNFRNYRLFDFNLIEICGEL